MNISNNRKKILLIDDDSDIHDLVQLAAKSIVPECEVISFFDPHEALNFIKEHSVDLVLLDLCFKVAHEGSIFIIELSKMAKENMSTPPVLVMSSLENGVIVDYVKEVGASDYLQKPMSVGQIASKILKHLKLSKEESSSPFDTACVQIQ